MGESAEAVTQILEAIGAGDQHAAEELLPLVYEELRRLAAARMAREAPGQKLQALQAAPAATGFYTNIPAATSPYTNSVTAGQKFFRLVGN